MQIYVINKNRKNLLIVRRRKIELNMLEICLILKSALKIKR
jgi:hypothetical protein